jgi:hypothetical protein
MTLDDIVSKIDGCEDLSKLDGNELMRYFVQVTKEKRKYDSLAKGASEVLESLQPLIQNYMDQNGIDKQTIDGMTLFPQEQFSVTTDVEKRIALMEYITTNALRDETCRDLEGMMNLNSRTLSAYFKERLAQRVQEDPNAQIEDVFPDDIRHALYASKTVKIMARAVAKKK